jgi:hypothetical protein
LASQQLKKKLLLARRGSSQLIAHILADLRSVDPLAEVAPLAALLASKAVVAELWRLAPDESQAFRFDSPEALATEGRWSIEGFGAPRVTLHLGWDNLCFLCSLEASWSAWPLFCRLTTETFNAAVYPDTLDWVFLRAGSNLYPLLLNSGPDPRLLTPPSR